MEGLNVPIPGKNNPIDWFTLIFDDTFLESICTTTNKYAFELFCGPNTTPKSHITRFKDVTVPELKVFLGLLLHTGIVKLNRIQDYWKAGNFFNIPFFQREHESR